MAAEVAAEVAVAVGMVAAWRWKERRCESDGGGTAALLALCGTAAPPPRVPPRPPPPPLCELAPPLCSFLTGNCEETPCGSAMPLMARLSCAMRRALVLRKRSISMSCRGGTTQCTWAGPWSGARSEVELEVESGLESGLESG